MQAFGTKLIRLVWQSVIGGATSAYSAYNDEQVPNNGSSNTGLIMSPQCLN